MKHIMAAGMAGAECFHEAERTAESRAIEYCEELALLFVRSPSTYQRADAYVLDTKGSRRPSGPAHPGALDVSLSFDAANAFGTPVRNRAKCNFALNHLGGLDLTGLAVEDETVPASELHSFKTMVSLKEIVFGIPRSEAPARPAGEPVATWYCAAPPKWLCLRVGLTDGAR